MSLTRIFSTAFCVLLAVSIFATDEVATTISHAVTLDDEPRYPPDFTHLEYVNPHAPKGGTLRLFTIGGFDTLNPFTVKGDPAAGLANTFYERLMYSPEDDSLSQYGVIAESIEIADDLSFVIFHLREDAKFHDGNPIDAEDVVFSFNTLVEKGLPFYRAYYGDVSKVEALGSHSVKFHLGGEPNRELPHILGQIMVLSEDYWAERDFSATTLTPPVTSGPYKIGSIEPGRFLILERVEDYWGADLPVNVGRFNFDFIRYDYVRDATVAVEAFKSGEYDYRAENSSKEWATAYDFPALNQGLVMKKELEHARPTGMQAFAINIRRDKFKNPKVREALSYAFDFEWANKNLFYGQYTRSGSYFSNSDLAATGLPSKEELEILSHYEGRVPNEVFTQAFEVPKTDGTGNARQNLMTATRLLREQGWNVVNSQLINPDTQEPMTIEFLLNSPTWERIVSPYIRNLARLGIHGRIRTVEPAQYQNRVRDFDFDVIVASFGQSRSPGNEQRNYWSSEAATHPGSRNLVGISDPVIDELVETLIEAESRSELIVATQALDRVLLWNHFVVPGWHINADRVLWWDKFGRPKIKPLYQVGLLSWWVDPDKSQRIQDFRSLK